MDQNGTWFICISDCLEKAPTDILWDLILQIQHKFRTGERGIPKSVRSYLDSKEVLMEIQSTFIERNPEYKGTPRGTHKDLMHEVRNLLSKGLVSYEDIRNARFSWACYPDHHLFGLCHGD